MPKILVANPLIGDPTFANTSVFLVKHNNDGACGFILNGKVLGKIETKKIELENEEQLKQLTSCKDKEQLKKMLNAIKSHADPYGYDITFGGPVFPRELIMLHTYEELKDKSDKIIEGLWHGGPEVFSEICLLENGLQQNKFRFFFGQSVWGAGQLDNEIKQNIWTVKDCELCDIFQKIPQQKSMYQRLIPSLN